ncbi:MAG: hypothetical protein J1F04_05150 [Oscillospiraceae bacterium]|nr:hypothetical protein [Oscillospiraceae bacterium]
MNYALWLNQRKIYSADEISDNLDPASLCGYFTAGNLVGWLMSHGGESYAKALADISPKDPELKEKLCEIFGGQPVKYKQFKSGNNKSAVSGADLSVSSVRGSFALNSSALGASFMSGNHISSGKAGSGYPMWKLKLMGSFNFSSYSFRSYLLNIGFGNTFGGSFSLSSFSSGMSGYNWEWEWERFLSGYGSFYSGSFAIGSFVYESFYTALKEFFSQKYGSWNFGSGNFGSWNFWALTHGSWNIFGLLYGSRGLSGSRGLPAESFGSNMLKSSQNVFIDSDEYDRILMECVFGCRLNGYGYGIHNI